MYDVREHLEYLDARHHLASYKFPKNMSADARLKTIDWLFVVGVIELKISKEAFFLSIRLFDRYMNTITDAKNCNHIQRIAAVCMWIGSKYEDIYPVNASTIECICNVQKGCKSTSRRDVLDCEITVLGALNYEIGSPTIMVFYGDLDRGDENLTKLISILCAIFMPIHYIRDCVSSVNMYCKCIREEQPFPDTDIAKIVRKALDGKYSKQITYIQTHKDHRQYFKSGKQ